MSDSPPPLMSLRAYAKRRGVQPMAVSNAIATGRLVKSVGRDQWDQPKISDPDLADREWLANTDLTKAPAYVKERDAIMRAGVAPPDLPARARRPPAETDSDDGSVGAATERLKSAQADLAELRFAEASGQLVAAADVRREWMDLLSQVRTKMLGLPTQVRQAIPDLTAANLTLIEDLIRAALEDLSEGNAS